MQMKTTMRYHLTSVRMTIINKSTNNNCWWGWGENPYALLVEMQIATVESSMEIPQKNKNGSAFWPSNPTFRNISEGTQNMNSKEHKHPHVHCSVIYTHQDMEAAQVSINGWVEKTTMAHLHKGILLCCKKEYFNLCDNMDGPGEHYVNEIN